MDSTKAVLTLANDVPGNHVPSSQVLFHEEELGRMVIMRRATFEELGEPDEVTVTIEPGDKLNPC